MIKPSVFVLGNNPPVLTPDPGAGKWGKDTPTLAMKALKLSLDNRLTKGLASHFGGDDAVKHLAHYLSNTGAPYTIDFQGLINEAPTAKKTQEIQIEAAKKFVESLPPGQHNITSKTGSLNHWISIGENRNWYFAVASHTTWIRGVANVKAIAGKVSFSLDYEYHFFDRYNWDGEKKVDIPIPLYESLPAKLQEEINNLPKVKNGEWEVTDKQMSAFHLQGLAKEFDMIATLRQSLSWQPKTGFVVYQVKAGDTLSKIAKMYYGDANKWGPVHAANKLAIPNPNLIRVGQEIKIPV